MTPLRIVNLVALWTVMFLCGIGSFCFFRQAKGLFDAVVIVGLLLGSYSLFMAWCSLHYCGFMYTEAIKEMNDDLKP